MRTMCLNKLTFSQSMPREKLPHYNAIVSDSWNRWEKAKRIQAFMLFMPNSNTTIGIVWEKFKIHEARQHCVYHQLDRWT